MLAAIAFRVIGRWLINMVIALLQRVMSRNMLGPMLTRHLGSIVSIALDIGLVPGIVGYFGIRTTSGLNVCRPYR